MKIALLGDLALIGRFSIVNNPDLMTDLLVSLASHLRSYDIVVASTETPLDSGKSAKAYKPAHISSDPKNIDILKYLGITL